MNLQTEGFGGQVQQQKSITNQSEGSQEKEKSPGRQKEAIAATKTPAEPLSDTEPVEGLQMEAQDALNMELEYHRYTSLDTVPQA
jgi:hypothetical protein